MTLTILVYLWMVVQDLFSWITTIGTIIGICAGFAVLPAKDFAYSPEPYKKIAKAALLIAAVSGAFLAFVPSKKQAAILIATYTASTVVQSTEAQKAMELLRLYVGKELDAEIAKLKKHD